ncbi:MAG: glucose 1-dehydrogenase [Deltaproteobacteria bacterium]|nr:glucose 1-dehydrogenase [Deltaproteobacteria bacterium]
MTMKLQDKVAFVTGGATGIGKTTARMFAREGAKVLVTTDSNVEGGRETVRLIKEAGGEATFFKCDVTKATEVEAAVDKCVETFGRLDYAFNNAGFGPDGIRWPMVPISDYPEDLWDKMIDVNLKGVMLCMKYEIRQMTKQKYGSIVNTSSVAALKPLPEFGAYNASKSGLIGLTKTAALEVAKDGIRVNVLLPGPTGGTTLMDKLLSSNPDQMDKFRQIVPIGRIAEPEEMAEAVIWLCSNESSFVTGLVMPVSGGLHI